MPLADFQSLVDDLVRDDTGTVSTADRDEALGRAVARYNQDKPILKVEDAAAPGGQVLNLPAGWQSEFSTIRSIEYPIGNVPPTLLETTNYSLYRNPSAVVVHLASAINAAQQVRFTYTQRRVLDGATDQIITEDREPVCCWAAALLCDQLSAYYAKTSAPTIQADAVDHRSRSQEYAGRAKTLRARYFSSLGLDEKKNVAAGVVVNLDFSDSRGGDRLTHPRRFR